ncbi:MAG: flagellar basal-body rod protein FlgF [Micavibrio aeruginosavorus]|nr:flagellar basal-body rod protein FlgF [Micavibrio aeruginosavorus]
MENAIYTGMSRAIALQRDMDTLANNIANMNTPGFRAQYMMYSEYVEKEKGMPDPLSMVLDYGQWMSNKPGAMQLTENPTDAALQGPGFFGVQGPDGETMYTRSGSFAVNVNGDLVSAEGNPILNNGGSPINIPADTTEIRIAEDGTISNQDGEIARLMVKEFDNINDLEPVGDNMYKTAAEAKNATKTRVMQGLLEGSNVNPVLEMTHMIDVHRAYQNVQRMLQSEHDRQRTMIQRLTRGS